MNLPEKLLSYHLNALGDPERTEIEEILLDSPEAVMEFIAIKREREMAEAPFAEPSPYLKARLRKAIAADYTGARPRFRKAGAWLAVAAAVIAVLALLGLLRARSVDQKANVSTSGISVDAANPNLDTL